MGRDSSSRTRERKKLKISGFGFFKYNKHCGNNNCKQFFREKQRFCNESKEKAFAGVICASKVRVNVVSDIVSFFMNTKQINFSSPWLFCFAWLSSKLSASKQPMIPLCVYICVHLVPWYNPPRKQSFWVIPVMLLLYYYCYSNFCSLSIPLFLKIKVGARYTPSARERRMHTYTLHKK